MLKKINKIHRNRPSSFAPCALVLAVGTASWLVAVGCKKREFNAQSAPKTSAGASAASPAADDATKGAAPDPSISLPALVDPALLNDHRDFPATETPPMDDLEDAVVMQNERAYSSLLEADGKSRGWVDDVAELGLVGPSIQGPFIVPTYEKRRSKAPQPLAAASVLRILRHNRSQFAQVREGGMRVKNPPRMGAWVPPIFADEKFTLNPDASKPFSSTYCQSFDQAGYSDVKWHYYCGIPAFFRACQRLLVGTVFTRGTSFSTTTSAMLDADFLKHAAQMAKDDYNLVTRYCTSETSGDPEWDKIFSEILKSDDEQYRKAFAAFYNSQVLDIPHVGKVNMYEYIMRSQLYAFDFAQQQAVLNAYYGDMKPAAEGPFDPKTECTKYRERRTFIDGDNPCDPNDPRKFQFVSNGR